MNKLSPLFLAFPLALSLAACSGADVSDDDGTNAVSDDELRTGGITEIDVRREAGLMPPGTCFSGRYTLDFASKKLDGNTCKGGTVQPVSRTLSADEFKTVKSTLSKVRTTKRRQSCPLDNPTFAMTVTRGHSTTDYIQQLSSCHVTSATPVTDASIGALVQVMEDLANAQSTQPITLEGTLATDPTDHFAISTDSGDYTLLLDGGQGNSFVYGRYARAVGTLEGAAMHVSEFLVCPAKHKTIDCMPPTNNPYCKNASWVEQHCNVSFVY